MQQAMRLLLLLAAGAYVRASTASCDADATIGELCCADNAASISGVQRSWASCCIHGPAVVGPESCAQFPGHDYSSHCVNSTCHHQCCKYIFGDSINAASIPRPIPSPLSVCPSGVGTQLANCDNLGVCGIDADALTEGHQIHWMCIAQYSIDTPVDCPDGWSYDNGHHQCKKTSAFVQGAAAPAPSTPPSAPPTPPPSPATPPPQSCSEDWCSGPDGKGGFDCFAGNEEPFECSQGTAYRLGEYVWDFERYTCCTSAAPAPSTTPPSPATRARQPAESRDIGGAFSLGVGGGVGLIVLLGAILLHAMRRRKRAATTTRHGQGGQVPMGLPVTQEPLASTGMPAEAAVPEHTVDMPPPAESGKANQSDVVTAPPCTIALDVAAEGDAREEEGRLRSEREQAEGHFHAARQQLREELRAMNEEIETRRAEAAADEEATSAAQLAARRAAEQEAAALLREAESVAAKKLRHAEEVLEEVLRQAEEQANTIGASAATASDTTRVEGSAAAATLEVEEARSAAAAAAEAVAALRTREEESERRIAQMEEERRRLEEAHKAELQRRTGVLHTLPRKIAILIAILIDV